MQALHQHVEDVLRAHQPAVEEREAGQRHQQHERGAREHPGGVARRELRRRPRRARAVASGGGPGQGGEPPRRSVATLGVLPSCSDCATLTTRIRLVLPVSRLRARGHHAPIAGSRRCRAPARAAWRRRSPRRRRALPRCRAATPVTPQFIANARTTLGEGETPRIGQRGRYFEIQRAVRPGLGERDDRRRLQVIRHRDRGLADRLRSPRAVRAAVTCWRCPYSREPRLGLERERRHRAHRLDRDTSRPRSRSRASPRRCRRGSRWRRR